MNTLESRICTDDCVGLCDRVIILNVMDRYCPSNCLTCQTIFIYLSWFMDW